MQWPSSDKFVAAPKNDGVTATIKQTPGRIGYIEYGYAKLTKANAALLQNKAGNYVEPGEKSGEAALATAQLGPDLRGWIEDPAGADAYPIATFTWMLFYKDQDDKQGGGAAQLVEYCVTKGQSIADSMGYIPLPAQRGRKGQGRLGRNPIAVRVGRAARQAFGLTRSGALGRHSRRV